MRRLLALALACLVPLITGCDTDRMNNLEKQNQELKARLDKQQAAQNYDLQARCSKDARVWFNENWVSSERDKDKIFLDFTNHYNAKFNKCFILVEYHYKSHLAGPNGDSWTNDMDLYDVYENSKYGNFMENHYTYYKPQISTNDEVILCEASGDKCKTLDEFNNFVRPYLSD